MIRWEELGTWSVSILLPLPRTKYFVLRTYLLGVHDQQSLRLDEGGGGAAWRLSLRVVILSMWEPTGSKQDEMMMVAESQEDPRGHGKTSSNETMASVSRGVVPHHSG